MSIIRYQKPTKRRRNNFIYLNMELKKTDATTHIEVLCNCPNCNAYLDIFDEHGVKESMGYEPRSENCDLEIDCSECGEKFLVTDIFF